MNSATTETAPEMVDAAKQVAGGNAWLLAIWLVALLPFLQAIITWDYDGDMSGGWFVLRHFSIPAIAGEIFVIYLALRGGMLPSYYFGGLPKMAKGLLAIWAIAAAGSILVTSGQMANSLLTLIRFLLHGLFLVSIIHLIHQARSFSALRWLHIIAIGITAYIAALTVFALTIPDPASFPWVYRLPSATNIRQIANIIAIPAMAPIALILFNAASRKWLYAIITFVIAAFIAWSGSRGALFGMGAATLSALILLRRLPEWKSLAAAVFAFGGGVAASLALPLPTGSFGLFRFAEKLQAPGNVTSGRMDIWIDTLAEIGKSPWIGYGSGRFNQNMHELHGIDFNHPHNFILQFTYDWGIIGAAAAIALLAALGFAIIKRAAMDPLAGFAALAAYLTLLAIGLVDGTLFYPLTIMLALATLAPIFALSQKQES